MVTREDGSSLVLAYDAALRLTNEVFYSSGGVPQATNSYGYNASGTRIRLTKPGVTLTNSVSPGYQIAQIRRASDGVLMEEYSYDSGGRVRTIARDGISRSLGYNTADQLTAVTNTSNGTWIKYTHDGKGRRTVSTNSSGVVRRFLVASSPGAGLESPLMVADASGNLQQGYVYTGYEPVMRYDAGGAVTYYLEDGIGSIIGLAPGSNPTTANTTRLFYDSFGNERGTNGPSPAIPPGTGGDFRFQGSWLETETGIYHFRARDYDQRTGRFLSRDPVQATVRLAETFNAYAFALNNPQVYKDPTGGFSIIEINVVSAKNASMQGLRQAAIKKVREKIFEELAEALQDALWKLALQFFPIDINALAEKLTTGMDFGNQYGSLAQTLFCKFFKKTQIGHEFHYQVRLYNDNSKVGHSGDPYTVGSNCDGPNPPLRTVLPVPITWAVPDFIISSKPPLGVLGGKPKAWFVGDFKATAYTFYQDYINDGSNGGGQHKEQFDAIVQYAKRNTITHAAVFIVGWNNIGPHEKGKRSPRWKEIRKTLGRQLTYHQVIGLMVTIID
jgi:RHS repeat-associated protein